MSTIERVDLEWARSVATLKAVPIALTIALKGNSSSSSTSLKDSLSEIELAVEAARLRFSSEFKSFFTLDIFALRFVLVSFERFFW